MKQFSILKSFYNRKLIYSILILGIVSLVMAITISIFIVENERQDYLRGYDITLNSLQRTIYYKQKNFANALSPLFDSAIAYDDVLELLRTSDTDTMDNEIKANITNIMLEIIDRDVNCVGIILYSNLTDQVFQFDDSHKSIQPMSLDHAFPQLTPYEMNALGHKTITGISDEFTKPASSIYGIAGTLGDLGGSSASKALGYVLILYDTSELTEAINDFHLDNQSLFTIISSNNEVLFNSLNEYDNTQDIYIPNIPRVSSDVIHLPAVKTVFHDEVMYTSSIYNVRYKYTVNYQVPYSNSYSGFTRLLIISLAIITCIISIALYVSTFKSTRKKVHDIQTAMSKIGDANLTYRIPSNNSEDEFAEIISGFNQMCDSLQYNVEKNYMQELQKKKAELYALQTSINPHFLYNTLELIRLQTLNGQKNDASQMILLLSSLYRNQINQKMFVSLAEELDQCENLIYLYQYRYENFDYILDVPYHLLDYILPKNSLQSLIENYFVHGIDKKRSDNFFELTASFYDHEGDQLIKLSFVDNGKSITKENLHLLKEQLKTSILNNEKPNGFALTNVHNRLQLIFDEPCGLYPSIAENGGFRIDLIIKPILDYEDKSI